MSQALEPVLDLVEDRAGMACRGRGRNRAATAVQAAMRAWHATGPVDFQRMLSSDPDVLADLVERLRVPETYFFRDRTLLASAVEALRHGLAVPGVVRVWSAGCASGEEPYSLVMAAADAGLPLERLSVLGTDISAGGVRRGCQGRYGSWSLRGVTEAERRRWFRGERDRHVLVDAARRPVTLKVHNLLDGPPGSGPFDLVLCRNVLIHLTSAAVQRAAVVLRDALAPGGTLLTASADPPLQAAGLCRVRVGGTVAYRREGAPGPPATPEGDPLAASPVSAPAPAPAPADQPPPAPSSAGATPEAGPHPGDAGPAGWGDGEARCRAAVDHLEAGRLDEARREAAAAAYLDPGLVVAHLLLGALADIQGRGDDARRSFRTAAALLEPLLPGGRVPLSDEPAGALLQVARQRAGG